MFWQEIGAVVLGYILGAIPFAHIITRWRAGKSIRQEGDGNAGARNVWHVVGPFWGTLVAVLDGLKGLGAVLLARSLLGASEVGQLLAGPAAILGHAFSPLLRFRGGKGLATTVGVLMAWVPWSTATALVITGVAQIFFRNMDRSIMLGTTAGIVLPPAFGYSWAFSLYALVICLGLWGIKLLDLAHEREVWRRSGWKGVGHSDWHGPRQAGGGPPTEGR